MVDMTIYSFGEISMVESALNSVAMIFGSATFNGGSLILLSFLIALLVTVMPAVGGGKVNYNTFLAVFLIYFAGIQPKTLLTIEDYYSGEVKQVDNIPLIVAYPASLASTISYKLGQLIETSTASPQSNTTFRDGGFADPLKLIYSFRKGGATINPYFSASLESFTKDCAIWSTGWDKKTAMSSPDLGAYLLNYTALPVVGLTVYFDVANQNGTTMTCQTAQTTLQGIVTSGTGLYTASDLAGLIKRSDGERPMTVPAGTEVTKLTNAFNDVTNGLLVGQQSAQQFMVNMFAMQALANGMRCGNAVSAQMDECIEKAQIFTAMEQSRLDSAAGASIFAKTVIPMMNIVMLLFYLFSPVVLITAMMFATKAIQIVFGYIMFAVWTQSWLPTAMLINSIINMQASHALSQIADGGVTMLNVHQFYESMATQIGLASTLFAMTPILSYALLTGGVQAMTKVASAMNQADHFDEKAMAPDAMGNSAIAKHGSMVGVGDNVSMNTDAHGNFVNSDTKGQIGEQKFRVGGALEKTATHNERLAMSDQENASSALKAQYAQATTRADTRSLNVKYGEALSKTKTDSAEKINTIVEELAQGTKLSTEDKTAMKGYIGAKLQMGTPLAEIIGTGANLAAEAGIEHGTAVSSANTLAANYKNTNTGAKKHVEALQTSFSEGKDKTLGLQVGAQLGNTLGADYQTAISHGTEHSQAAEKARRASLSVGATAESDSSTVARAVMEKGGFLEPGSTPGHETYNEPAFVNDVKARYLKLGGEEKDWQSQWERREFMRQKTWNVAGSKGGAALEILNDYSTQNNLDDGAQLISSAVGESFKKGGGQFTQEEQAVIDGMGAQGQEAKTAATANTQHSQQAAGNAAQVQAPATGVNPAAFNNLQGAVSRETHTAPVVQGGMPLNTVSGYSDQFSQAETTMGWQMAANGAGTAASVAAGAAVGVATLAATGGNMGAALTMATGVGAEGMMLTDKFLPKGSVNDTAGPMFQQHDNNGNNGYTYTPAQSGSHQSLSGAPDWAGGGSQYVAPAAAGPSAPSVMGEYSVERKDSEGHKFTINGLDESGRPAGSLVEKQGGEGRENRGYYVTEDGKWFLGEEKWKNGMPADEHGKSDPTQFKGMYFVGNEGVSHHDGKMWQPVDEAPAIKPATSDTRKTNYVATTYQAGPKYVDFGDPFKKAD